MSLNESGSRNKRSVAFYDVIGSSGLASLSLKKWDKAILRQVEEMLGKDLKILDVGCGYGRLAVPLLRKGYDLYGIDLSGTLLKDLKSCLPTDGLKRRFKAADMCAIPFPNNTFDVVLCLWSSFDELLLRKDQLGALKEMKRVLKSGGVGFIEGHLFLDPSRASSKSGMNCDVFSGHRKRIRTCHVAGGIYNCYNHGRDTMESILRRAGLRDFTVRKEWFGWRERMITRFRKEG